ncbi:MAG TPA: LysR family transcriptional regulator [Kineosporiaceae bacterium]
MSVGLPQLRAFVAVADAGGFSAAAAHLGVSQSAVSHAIAGLEREVGRPLLTRGMPPRLTALGGQLLVHARLAVVSAAAFEDLARGEHEDAEVALVLAVPPTVGHALAAGLLDRWHADFPRLSVGIFEGDDDEVAGWLDDATADLAVLVDPPQALRGAVTLARDAFVVVLRRDHPLAGTTAINARDLDDDAFLLSTGGCERHIRQAFGAAGARWEPAHRVRQLSTLFAMVRAGVGVTVVPELASGMAGPDLVLVPLAPRVRRTLVLTGPLRRPWHPRVRALLDAARGGGEELEPAS